MSEKETVMETNNKDHHHQNMLLSSLFEAAVNSGSEDVNGSPAQNTLNVTQHHPSSSKKKKKRKRGGSNNSRKKQERERFWIEDCSDTKIRTELSGPVLEVLITRSTLEDDYRQAPLNNVQQDCRTMNNSSMTSCEGKNTTSPKDKSECEKKDQVGCNEQLLQTNDALLVEKEEKGYQNQMDCPKCKDSAGNNTKEELDPAAQTTPLPVTSICIKRSNNAKIPFRCDTSAVTNFVPLPNGDCGDGIVNPYPPHVVPHKFWSQRRRLFSRFDDGIQLDSESWFSVTPEAIATHITSHLVGLRQKMIILDPFCGCGGNAIAFAKNDGVELVIGVDTDRYKLKMAAHNAAIYNVPKSKLRLIHDNGCRVMNCFENGKLQAGIDTKCQSQNEIQTESGFAIGGMDLLPNKVGAVFLSPPWGGIDYVQCGKRSYELKYITVVGFDDGKQELDGEDILRFAVKCLGRNHNDSAGSLAYFLPKNTNGVCFAKSLIKVGCSSNGPVVLEQNVLNGKLKTITAYVGL